MSSRQDGDLDYMDFIKNESKTKSNIDFGKCLDCGKERSSVGWSVWMEGPRWVWDEEAEKWTRNGPVKVALKRLNNSQNISEEYFKQLYESHRSLQSGNTADCYGITKDPTSNYMFVMRYYENGDLHSYLDKVQGMLYWRDIVDMLWGISGGIENIHENGLIHGYLHGGSWTIATCDDPEPSELSDQFNIAEEKKFSDLEQNKFQQQKIHPQAFYTSRLLYFPELINISS
ncbi:unnamed protein product [Rhizophagus irregularis]|nr:unnamed protein product [Rhizophagus irregularis]